MDLHRRHDRIGRYGDDKGATDSGFVESFVPPRGPKQFSYAKNVSTIDVRVVVD